MKNILLTFLLTFIVTLGYSQLKVASTGFVGINETNPPERLTLTTSGAPANFLVRRSDTGNFIKAVGGGSGSGFFFKQENFYALTPGDSQTDQSVDWANSIVLYGPNATGSKAGKVGIGAQNPTEKLEVTGNVKAASFITTSDKRLKRDITEFNYGLEEVLKLDPIMFEYNGQGGTLGGEMHVGLVAQQLQSVVPELVKEFTYNKYNVVTLDDPEEIVFSENYLSIKDNEVKYLLINAIKDQQSLINEQSERIDELVAQLEEVRERISTFSEGGNNPVIESEVTLTYHDMATLEQNVPNPFNGRTLISYTIPTNAQTASINFYDPNGKLIREKHIDHTGQGTITLNANDIPSGTYSYHLIVDGKRVDTKKMILSQ